jgi:hypothetical protein
MSEHGPGWSDAQKIDQAARPIFEAAMHGWCIPSALNPDIGIDYSVELLAEHPARKTATGDGDFLVQLKGETDAKYPNGDLSQSFPTRDLRYFLASKRRPVFLVVVDVNTRRGYWKFLQRFAAEEADQGKLASQESITIRIPAAQTLEDPDAFRAAVAEADRWMADRWPGAPHAAVRNLKNQIETGDPRVVVEISADENTTRIVVHPKEPIQFSIVVEGSPDALRRFEDDAFGRGLPVDSEKYEVKIRGRGMPGGDAEEIAGVHMAKKFSGHAVLTSISSNGKSSAPLTLQGEFQAGTTECRFLGKLPSGVLEMDLAFAIPQVPPTSLAVDIRADFRFRPQAWKGRSLSILPDFGVLDSFFSEFSDTHQVTIQVFCEGNPLFAGHVRGEMIAGLLNFAAGIDFFRVARRLTKRWKSVPVFPGEITEDDKNTLCVLDELERGVPFPLNEAEVMVAQSVAKGDVPSAPRKGVAERVVVMVPSESAKLFGSTVPLGATRRECAAALSELVSRDPDPNAQDREILRWKIVPQAPWLFSITGGSAIPEMHPEFDHVSHSTPSSPRTDSEKGG